MNIEIQYKDRYLIVALNGELDHHNAEEVKNKIKKEIEKEIAIDLILDLSGLKFMDSSGIGIILGRYKEIQKLGGKMAVAGMNPTVNKILTLSGLHKIIYTYNSPAQAITSLKEEK